MSTENPTIRPVRPTEGLIPPQVTPDSVYHLNASEGLPVEEGRKIHSTKLSITLLISAIIGGIGGALLLGHMLEHIARAIFGLEAFNLTSTLIVGSILTILTAVGTFTLIAAFWVQNKKYRFWIIFFSMPLPMVIELIDLPLKFWLIINDAITYYGLVF